MYNTSNLNSMKRIVYMLAVLFYGTSLFAQDKPFDIEHAPAPLFRCPIYDGPTDPTLEWNAERQEWWMFYTQRRANVPNLQEVACVYGSKVGIAATKNNGKNWYYVGTANLPEPMQGQSTFWAPDSKTNTGVSKDLTTWKVTGKCEIDDVPHEGPIVFYWKNKYWNIIDECNLGYVGLHCYESDDATNWTYNSTILNKPGLRPDDFDQGRHCDVVVIGDRAFIFYFTHPGRTYKMDGMEVEENTWNYHRASIQIAELEYVDGKIVCDRDKYAKKVPSPIERKKK